MTSAIAIEALPTDSSADEDAITVLVAVEHQLVRQALSTLLGLQSDLDVVDGVGVGDEVLAACVRTRAAVLVLDSRLPGLDAISAAEAVRRALPRTEVLVLTPAGHAIELRRALKAGVRGYLSAHVSPGELVDAIRQLAAGHQVLDPSLVVDAVGPRTPAVAPTASELITLRLVATGLSNKDIAARLCLSHGTVRNYVSNLIAKTNARNRVDAIRVARELAWI